MTAAIPADVAAYLEQAAVQMAEEEGFQPDSEASMTKWITERFQAICELARTMMVDFATRIISDERVKAAAAEYGAKRVYERIPKPATKSYNPRFVAYAKSRNLEPEEVIAVDGTMANYLCWRP